MTTLVVAFRAMLRNKLRAFLTALGVIIGVASVIVMMAIGAGAKAQVDAAFDALGPNLILVVPGSRTAGGAFGGFGTANTLTWEDLAALRTEVSAARGAVPTLRSNESLVSESTNWTTAVVGTTPEYFDMRNWEVTDGALFTQSDVDAGAKIVVLGTAVTERLFGSAPRALGQTVRIGRSPFVVAGVLSVKGQSPFGQNYDDTALIPSTTFAQRIQGGIAKYLVGQIMLQAVSRESVPAVLAEVKTLLRERHRLAPGAEDDFSVMNLAEIAGAQQQSADTMTKLLASVAAVSLIVGGIGIMNIMLVSVTERTREIGLRMAVGAKPRSILIQFMVEALVLSVAGGAMGVAVGVLASSWVGREFRWPIQLQLELIGISVVFAAAVGLVFGIYPAYKASRLDPIEALRWE